MTTRRQQDSPQKLIQYYSNEMNRMSRMTQPGEIRSAKGRLVEDLSERIIRLAWRKANGGASRLSFGDTVEYPMPVQPNYIAKQPKEVADYINSLQLKHLYKAHVDRHVFIDGMFVMGVECKSYSENAMLKRILVDFWLLKRLHSDLTCCLLQLESQLTGDYSNLRLDPPKGSASTHTLMSYFSEIDLKIFTLLDGERKIQQPIHKRAYFKELRLGHLNRTINGFSQLLVPFA